MNKWEKLAELLGVTFNYPFEVSYKGKVHTLTITKYGIVEDGAIASTYIYSIILPSLIEGIAEILPFKPQHNKTYWYVDWDKNGNLRSTDWVNEGTMIDFLIINNGLAFRTQEEAEKNKQKVYEKLVGKSELR